MSKQLKKQIAALTAQVASLKIKQQPKRQNKKKRRSKARNGNNNNPGADGRLTVSRWELFTELKVNKDQEAGVYYEKILPTDKILTWLHSLSKSFSRIVWHSITVEYRPAVGAMKDGSVVVGIDWETGTTVQPDKAKVQSCTPSFMVPVWQRRTMTLPVSRLQSRKEYILDAASAIDTGPGDILAYVTCTKTTATTYFGDLWVHYNVSLFGPK